MLILFINQWKVLKFAARNRPDKKNRQNFDARKQIHHLPAP